MEDARNRRPRLLLVDSDDCFRRAMAIALRLEGIDVLEARDQPEALAAIEKNPVGEIDLALVEVLLRGERSAPLLAQLTATCPSLRLVSIGKRELQPPLAAQGEALHLEKPLLVQDVLELLGAIRLL